MQHKQLPRKNRLQKAFFYAKVTAAVAAGAWLSFQPLASPAQATKAPQQGQKTASAPVQKPAIKEKTISFSEAQKQASATGAVQQKCNAVKVGGKQPPLPKYDSTHPYAGVRRILIELAGEPAKAQLYAHEYAMSVDTIAAMQARISIPASKARQVAEAKWQIINSELGIVDYDLELWQSVSRNAWDCDNSGFAQRDADLKNGSKTYLVLANTPAIGHVVARMGDFAFDTRLLLAYGADSIARVYPSIYGNIWDADSLQTFTYLTRALKYARLCRTDKSDTPFALAVAYYTQSISRFPGNEIAVANLGILYLKRGMPEKAVEFLTMALGIDPNDAFVHYFRAEAYNALGNYKAAEEDTRAYNRLMGF